MVFLLTIWFIKKKEKEIESFKCESRFMKIIWYECMCIVISKCMEQVLYGDIMKSRGKIVWWWFRCFFCRNYHLNLENTDLWWILTFEKKSINLDYGVYDRSVRVYSNSSSFDGMFFIGNNYPLVVHSTLVIMGCRGCMVVIILD